MIEVIEMNDNQENENIKIEVLEFKSLKEFRLVHASLEPSALLSTAKEIITENHEALEELAK